MLRTDVFRSTPFAAAETSVARCAVVRSVLAMDGSWDVSCI